MGKCQHGMGTAGRCKRDSYYCSPGSTTKRWCLEHGQQRGGQTVYFATKELGRQEEELQSPIVKKKKNQARAGAAPASQAPPHAAQQQAKPRPKKGRPNERRSSGSKKSGSSKSLPKGKATTTVPRLMLRGAAGTAPDAPQPEAAEAAVPAPAARARRARRAPAHALGSSVPGDTVAPAAAAPGRSDPGQAAWEARARAVLHGAPPAALVPLPLVAPGRDTQGGVTGDSVPVVPEDSVPVAADADAPAAAEATTPPAPPAAAATPAPPWDSKPIPSSSDFLPSRPSILFNAGGLLSSHGLTAPLVKGYVKQHWDMIRKPIDELDMIKGTPAHARVMDCQC